MSLTEKGFTGLIGKIQRAEGTLRSLVQEAIEDALAYSIDRQTEGHGLDLRRLTALQTATASMKSINSQRLSDYLKTCLVDIDGKNAIGWNQKEQAYKLLKKGTTVSLLSFETRGNWFDFGKVEKLTDDFDFGKLLAGLLTKAEKHMDKLSPEDQQLVRTLRASRTTIRMQDKPTAALPEGMSATDAAAAGAC